MTFNPSGSIAFNPSGGAAIVGLGMTEMTREYTYSATGLAAIAIREAIADAGLTKDDVDGLLVNHGVMATCARTCRRPSASRICGCRR